MTSSLYAKQWPAILRYFMLICVCLPLLTSCESRRIIVNALDEREANEILVFLSAKNIDATKVQNLAAGGTGATKLVLWDISVSNEQALEAMSLLNQAGLPRRRSQNLLNIFTGAGLVPSEMEQKIRYQAGLAEQIASTIRKMDGILDTEVQISFPEEEPLNPTAQKQPITASVFVKHNGILEDPNSHLVTKIKRLVAAGVPGLNYDSVTVVGERARYSEFPLDFNLGASEDAKQYVTVWSLIIAKDSLQRFRIIFFSFTVLILLFTLALIWMFWKIYPILKEHGGIKELFHLKPMPIEKKETPPVVTETKEEVQQEKTEEEKSLEDKNVDQT